MDYLEGLKVDEFDRKIVDERKSMDKETWNLDTTLLVFIYEKLNHYMHLTNTDMEYHTFVNFNLKEVTELELIEEIKEDIRKIYNDNDIDEDYHTKNIRRKRLFYNLGEVFPSLWW